MKPVTELAPTPLEKFYQWERSAPDTIFLRQSAANQWIEYTWSDVAEMVRRVAGFLRARNLPAGSRIGLLATNCAEWLVVDLAIMLAGHVSVPLYAAQDIRSGRYIFDHAGVSLVFVGHFAHEQNPDTLLVEGIYRVALSDCVVPCDISLPEIFEHAERFEACPLYPREQLFTLIYTSGTTGNPKGVMHSLGACAEVVQRRTQFLPSADPGARERFISYLPLAHVAERVGIAIRAVYGNAELSFSAGPERFAEEMREVRPTGFFAVPRLWEKFRQGLEAAMPGLDPHALSDAQKLAVRQRLGLDQARIITTGAAATAPDIMAWYAALGIRLQNAYGMTENLIDGCIDMSESPADPGCVGKPLPGVQLRFTEDGEVCFRSAGLMQGYYKEPDKTALVLHAGWYHTGDRGYLDAEGRLVLTGRVGDIFKTAKGKFVNPLELEHKLTATGLFEQLCVVGQGLAQPVLIARPFSANCDIRISTVIEQINTELAPHERIGQILLTDSLWSADNGLLTPTLKVRRQAVADRYLPELEPDVPLCWCKN
ncbi:AMP-binding protein [Simiduia agarivorans]|uniref:AMP-dependent synthetase and ligase n=1 Tax=Simiduia agarivorans (strain DSM 21679 / JCM 13881 / BCRC 17597 / SA1) TaxID=1117647 RepID=K4L2G7_SIMAS|nr:AMP-binding protein [Simiduia agarivorans]AFV00383.1 AMP-dependent synthetase and ligase [Simiduia agarivorans SA1 = DSM 21679]